MCTFELAVPIYLLVASYHILPSPYQNHNSLHGLFLNPVNPEQVNTLDIEQVQKVLPTYGSCLSPYIYFKRYISQ